MKALRRRHLVLRTLTRGRIPQLCSHRDLCGGETVGIRLETEKLIRWLYELGRLQRELEEKEWAAIMAINPYLIRASPDSAGSMAKDSDNSRQAWVRSTKCQTALLGLWGSSRLELQWLFLLTSTGLK